MPLLGPRIVLAVMSTLVAGCTTMQGPVVSTAPPLSDDETFEAGASVGVGGAIHPGGGAGAWGTLQLADRLELRASGASFGLALFANGDLVGHVLAGEGELALRWHPLRRVGLTGVGVSCDAASGLIHAEAFPGIDVDIPFLAPTVRVAPLITTELPFGATLTTEPSIGVGWMFLFRGVPVAQGPPSVLQQGLAWSWRWPVGVRLPIGETWAVVGEVGVGGRLIMASPIVGASGAIGVSARL